MDLIERSKQFDWINYSISEYSNEKLQFDYEPKYRSITEWLSILDKKFNV